MKKKWLLAPMAAVLLLAACGETEVEKVSNGSKTEAKSNKKAEVFKVGDTIKVNGVEITIKKAQFTKPAQYSEAKNGSVLTLDVALKNTNEESAFIDNTEFQLYDKGDNQMEDYFGYDDLAISKDINAGKKASGKLYFDVKKSKSYELVYEPTFTLDSKEIKWNIKVQ
ncbi:DUF4352 domain-containing protein [Viridibacillus sp. NPDC096237]|uniref:DUF4352 domain-containing protein n=1 Tax=Viridibacillus sp. NPDC096237 TaxID=3390721 RepID=UPI003CFD3732